MAVTFTPKKLAFKKLTIASADIYDSGANIGEVHSIILCNTFGTTQSVVINLNDGSFTYPIFTFDLVAKETLILQFINEGLIVDAASKLTGSCTSTNGVTILVNGSERAVV
jgi:hypothetical protein